MGPAVDRLRAGVACLVLTALVFTSEAGRVVSDTKLDLTVDPLGLLSRSLHLWDAQGGAGQLQNQAYGYLFPLGPFMALLHALDVPPWAAQRLWQSLVLCTAFLGVRALAARMELGNPPARLLGAAAYSLAARPLSQIGDISIEVWPYALAPWVLVPLVSASKGADPRRCAALSGLAVLLVGGVNGAATLAVVPLGVVWLMTRPPGAARRRLAAWWALAVACATAWWLGPLLLLGRYSPPFLDAIESAAVTTAQNGLWAALTGNTLWLQYLTVGGAARPAGYLLVSEASLVLCGTAVAALGVFALVRRDTPHRTFLVASFGLGVLLVTAGHLGALAGPLAESQRTLLDGALAPFRNVHKYDAVVRLPLILALTHLAATARQRRPKGIGVRRPFALLAGLAVLGAATPALGQLQPPGSWTALPSYWSEVADFLEQEAAAVTAPPRAMLVPASSFGDYAWGRPGDEPLQPLARSPWVVRDAVPLGGPGVTRVLDSVEEVLRSGRGSPALGAYLARAGVRFLVVRNDLLDLGTTHVRPVVVHASLAASPGLVRVATFGPLMGAGFSSGASVVDAGLSPLYPAVEIFEVEGGAQAVASWPRVGTQRVSGGPESVLGLLERGVLAASSAVRLAGEPYLPGEESELRTVTDGYREREVSFGRVGDIASATLGAGSSPRAERRVHDYLPVPVGPSATTAVARGALTVSASSSASDAEAFLVRGRDHHPMAAFDADGATSWVTGGVEPRGQWVQATFAPQVISSVEVRAALVPGAVTPARVRVSTDTQVAEVPVIGSTARVELSGVSSTLRVTVLAVQGAVQAGVTTVEVAALTDSGPLVVQRSLKQAPDAAQSTGGRLADPRVSLHFQGGRRDRPGCLPAGHRILCGAALPLGDEDDAAVDSTFTLDEQASFDVRIAGRVRPGAELEDLLQAGQVVRASATSSLVRDVRQRAAAVLDGDATTSWLADPLDPAPTLTLSWSGVRRLDGLRVAIDPFLPASRPRSVSVRADRGQPQVVALSADGVARLKPVRGTRVQVSFPDVESRLSVLRNGSVEGLPVGISELTLLGPGPALRQQLVRDRVIDLPCGQGPALELDGEVRAATEVSTTVGQLLDTGQVEVQVCTGAVSLAAGQHHLRVARTPTVQVTDVQLVDRERPTPVAGASRVGVVGRWDDARRDLRVGPGEESFLVVHEAFNPGWQATLGPKQLQPARLDGWQQGFVLPAGTGGDVRLEFVPDRSYRVLLLAGALLALLLVAVAATPRPAGPPRLQEPAVARRRPKARPLAWALAAATLGVLAGPAGLLAWLLAAGIASSRPRLLPGVAALAVLGAGGLIAMRPWPDDLLLTAPVQALCLFALAAVLVGDVPLLRDREGRRARSHHSGTASPPAHRGVLHDMQAEPGDDQAEGDDDRGEAPEVTAEQR